MAFGCTPGELSERITVGELTEYKALYNLSPWGDERQDFRSALQTAALVAVMGDGEVHIERYAFQPIHDRARRKAHETAEAKRARHRAGFEALNAILAAKAKGKGNG